MSDDVRGGEPPKVLDMVAAVQALVLRAATGEREEREHFIERTITDERQWKYYFGYETDHWRWLQTVKHLPPEERPKWPGLGKLVMLCAWCPYGDDRVVGYARWEVTYHLVQGVQQYHKLCLRREVVEEVLGRPQLLEAPRRAQEMGL